MNFIYRHSLTYFDKFIGRNMVFDDSFHFIIHGRRKSIGLFYIFELCSNFFYITNKSHIQHSIYFIQNEIFSDSNIDYFLIHKIHQSTWSRDNNCRIFFEDIFLNKWTRSSIQTSKTYSIKFSKISNFFSYLYNKFSCRSKN